MKKNNCLSAKPSIVFRQEEGGAFLYDSDNGDVSGLNQTGAFIWTRCDGTRTLGEIIEEMLTEFPGADKETAEKDAGAMIEELKTWGYVTENNGERKNG